MVERTTITIMSFCYAFASPQCTIPAEKSFKRELDCISPSGGKYFATPKENFMSVFLFPECNQNHRQ